MAIPDMPVGNSSKARDDDGDSDAVTWLLEQAGGENWTYPKLIENLRRQPLKKLGTPEDVVEAETFALRHGVHQIEIPRGNGRIVRLVRTDPQAPHYADGRAQKLPQLRGTAAFEVLWNPALSEWETDDYLRIQAAIAEGGYPIGNRSTGARKQGIERGDRIFLFYLEQKNRGLIASGHAASEVYFLDAWRDGHSGDVPYIDVAWDVLLEPHQALPWTEILREIPEFPVKFQSSGQIIDPVHDHALDELWQKYTRTMALAGIAGKGSPGVEEGYSYGVAKRRKHQTMFRNLLFRHYPAKCFVCGFDQIEVLEAAHIIPDCKGGRSNVENGRLMCSNHHRAHDAGLFKLESDLPIWVDDSIKFMEPARTVSSE